MFDLVMLSRCLHKVRDRLLTKGYALPTDACILAGLRQTPGATHVNC
jgi:hypothetical protein